MTDNSKEICPFLRFALNPVSKQTIALIIILFFFTAGLLFFALNKSSYNPKDTPVPPVALTPTTNPKIPDTSLLFGDLQIVLASGSATTTSSILTPSKTTKKYSLPIIINTGANNVTVVQLELAFDPDFLTNVNINASGFFENPAVFINHVDNEYGRISFALGFSPPATQSAEALVQKAKKGKGTIAILTFQTNYKLKKINDDIIASKSARTQQLGQTSITFLPKTFVVSPGLEQSALKSTNSAKLQFGI